MKNIVTPSEITEKAGVLVDQTGAPAVDNIQSEAGDAVDSALDNAAGEKDITPEMAEKNSIELHVGRLYTELLEHIEIRGASKIEALYVPVSKDVLAQMLKLALSRKFSLEDFHVSKTLCHDTGEVVTIELSNDKKTSKSYFVFEYTVAGAHGLEGVVDSQSATTTYIGVSEWEKAVKENIANPKQDDLIFPEQLAEFRGGKWVLL